MKERLMIFDSARKPVRIAALLYDAWMKARHFIFATAKIRFNQKMLSQKDKKRFRAIGHHLSPVVTIAGKGLSESVLAELSRAIEDHELIKIKIIAERDERKELLSLIEMQQGVTIIQSIGKVALIYKPSKKADPALSNILRANIL